MNASTRRSLALALLPAVLAGCASGGGKQTRPAQPPELVTRKEPGLQSKDVPSSGAATPAEGGPARPFQKLAPMQVVSLADANDPIISFRLVFRSGSIDDPAGKEGLTNLTSTLMAEGGTKSLTSAQLLETLFPLAAELSASTSKELTVFEGRVHRDHLETFFTLFTDVLLAPRFDAREFERLRADAINVVEKQLRSQDDETLGKVALDALMYQGHPYGHFTVGTVDGLKALTLDDVKAQAKAVFTQDRLVIGLGGATSPDLEKRLKERLAALPAEGKPAVELPAPTPRNGAVWILPKDTLSTAVSMGFPYPLRRGDADFYKVAFALSYLGEHRQFNGVLFSELREKRGLNYGDYAYAEHFAQEGYGTFPLTNIARRQQSFSIWIRPVEPQNGVFATRGAVYFLQRLLDEGISQEDFERTRGFMTGYTRLWEQTAQRRLGYAIDALLYGTPDFLEGYRQAMQEMSPASIRDAARRHLSVDKLAFVFVAKDAQELKRVLTEQPPTPHRYVKDGKVVEGYPTQVPPSVPADDAKIAPLKLPIQPSLIELRDTSTFMQR